MDIYFNDIPLPPIHINCGSEITINGKPLELKPECDRCHNRKKYSRKILPIRTETLCDDCKHVLELIDYIFSDD